MSAWEIPKFMADYLARYAKEHVPDSDVALWVEDYPPPSNLKMVPELDASVKRSLRDDGKSAVVDADDDLVHIQTKIQEVLGPLGVAWAQLHQHIHGTFPELDGKSLLDQLQKSATLVAHCIQKVSWYRRIHVLSGVGKIKEVKEVLKREKTQEIFKNDASGQLFSKEFYDSLKTEKSSKPSNVVELFKPKKKETGTKKPASASSTHTSKFIPTGSKRPFSANPFQTGGGARYNGNNGRDGYYNNYKSKNPFNSNSYKDNNNNRGKYQINLRCQHALNSNMAAKSNPRASGDMGDISGHTCDGSFGRKGSKISDQLEGSDKGQESPKHSKRVAGSLNLNPNSKEYTEGNQNEQNGGSSHGYGNREHVDKRSYKGGDSETQSISKQCVCHPKRGGKIQTDYKSEGLEPICSLPSLQNGGAEGSQAPFEERGLDVQDGLKRRIFFDSSAPRIPKVCQILEERDSIRVPLSGLRSGTGPTNIHKINEGSHLPSQEIRNMPGHLPGRPANNGGLKTGTSSSAGHDIIFIPPPGTHYKHEKVCTGAFPDNGIPRGPSEQSGAHIFPSRGKDSEIDFKMSRSSPALRNIPAGTLLFDGYPESNGTCSVAGPSANSFSATTEHPGSGQEAPLRLGDSDVTGGETRTKMVDTKPRNPQGKSYLPPATRADHLFRCGEDGWLGGGVPLGLDRRPMEQGREISQHKFAGTNSGGTGHKNLHKGLETEVHSHENRQHLGTFIPAKNGGDEKLGHAGGCQEDMGVPLRTPDHHYCRMDPFPPKYNSRLGIQKRTGLIGMETLPQNFLAHLPKVGLSRCRPIRIEGIPPVGQVCQLETGSGLPSGRRVLPKLGPRVPVRFSAILPDHESLVSDTDTERKQDDCSSSNMADASVVSSASLYADRHTNFATSNSKSTVKFGGGNSSSNSGLVTTFSGLVSVRDRLQAEGFSDGASNLILHARRRGSTQTYESAWKKWSLWCGQRGLDPFKCHVRHCLDYLADLFQKGHPYRTIGVHRSAISAYHEPVVEGSALISLGKHPSVCALMSGVHNLRPPVAKYSFTWDVEVVLGLFKSWPFPLDPKRLTMKAVTLLALIAASRGAELHLFDLNYLADYGEYYSFELPGTTKNGKEGVKPKPIEYHKHLEEVKLCPFTCISQYKLLTSPWRTDGKPSRFFLSFKAPHKPVVRSTLARWVKETLLLADVDTKTFQAHSIRGASTSKAFLKGLSVKEVIDHGRWSRESTWQRFYHRPVDSASKRYQDGVLL